MLEEYQLIEQKREELKLALSKGEVNDPFTATILGSVLLAHIVGAAALAAAAAAASYGIQRLMAPRGQGQQIGLMKGTVQVQNSGPGRFIPEIYGGAPVVTLVTGASASWTNNQNVSTGGSGQITKNAGTDRVYNAGAVMGPITADQDAFIKFVANVGDRQSVAVGFSTSTTPYPSSPTFTPDPPRAPFSLNSPLLEAGVQLTRVATGLDQLSNVLYENVITPITNSVTSPSVGAWVSGDIFRIEKRKNVYHIYHNFAEISKFTPPTPSTTVYIAVTIWSSGAGLTTSFVQIGGDIGLPPSSGSGGCKVPAMITWAVPPQKNSQSISTPHGGKGHAPAPAQQIYYTIDFRAKFARGPLDLIRLYGNTDILLNFDPQLIGASGVYTANESAIVVYDPNYPPTALGLDITPYTKSNASLYEDPGDPGGGGGSGSIQHGASQIAVYEGTPTQLQDPTEEADVDGKNGIGSTSADRNHAGIGFTGLNLTRWQGLTPNLTAVWQHKTLKTLDTIYGYLCQRIVDQNGNPLLTAGDYDFSALSTVKVRGMLMEGRRFSPAEIMDNTEIQDVYNYFTTEGEGKILGFANGSEPSITIPETELGWIDAASDMPAIWSPIGVSEADETKLPKQIDLTYINQGDDWDPDTQSAMRKVTLGNSMDLLQVALTLNPDEARQAAERRLMRAYIEGKSVKFTLSWKYLFVYPGYKIIVPSASGITYTLRLASVTGGVGVRDCEAFALEISAFNPSSVSFVNPVYNPGRTIPSMTILGALDLPRWRGDDGNRVFGMDFVGTPRDTNIQAWTGFGLFIKRGTQWIPLEIFSSAGIMGVVVSTASLGTDPDATDNVGQIIVDLYGTRSTLTSISESDMIAGAQRAAVGDMIIGFAGAVRVNDGAPNRWLLTVLRNGQFGTEEFITVDNTGRNFVLLDNAVHFVALDPVLDGLTTIHLKAVSFGASLADSPEITTVCTGKAMKANQPTNLLATRSSSGDWYIAATGNPSVSEMPASFMTQIRKLDGTFMRDLPIAAATSKLAGVFTATGGQPVTIENNNLYSTGAGIATINGIQEILMDGIGITAKITVDQATSTATIYITADGPLGYGPAVGFTADYLDVTHTRFSGIENFDGTLPLVDLVTVDGVVYILMALVGTEVRIYASTSGVPVPGTSQAIMVGKQTATVFPALLRIFVSHLSKVENVWISGLTDPRTIYALRQQQSDDGQSDSGPGLTSIDVEMWQTSPLGYLDFKGFSIREVFP